LPGVVIRTDTPTRRHPDATTPQPIRTQGTAGTTPQFRDAIHQALARRPLSLRLDLSPGGTFIDSIAIAGLDADEIGQFAGTRGRQIAGRFTLIPARACDYGTAVQLVIADAQEPDARIVGRPSPVVFFA
jgi:hypothetical protein